MDELNAAATRQPSRIVRYCFNVSESESGLCLEVDKLQEQIQSLRSTHTAEVRMDQNKAQEELAQLQVQYEEKNGVRYLCSNRLG
jgi:hypothetical protein